MDANTKKEKSLAVHHYKNICVKTASTQAPSRATPKPLHPAHGELMIRPHGRGEMHWGVAPDGARAKAVFTHRFLKWCVAKDFSFFSIIQNDNIQYNIIIEELSDNYPNYFLFNDFVDSNYLTHF